MKTLIAILLFTSFGFAQTKCIVLTKTKRDSLVNILLKKPVVINAMNNSPTGKIDIYCQPLKDTTKFILPWDLFSKAEWQVVKNNIPTKYLTGLTIRMVADSELYVSHDPSGK